MLAGQAGSIEVEEMANDLGRRELSRRGSRQLGQALRGAKNTAGRRHVQPSQRVDQQLLLRPRGDLCRLVRLVVAGRHGVKKKLRAAAERGSIAPRQPWRRSVGTSNPKG